MAPDHAALQVLYHRQLPERSGQYHLVLLRQLRAPGESLLAMEPNQLTQLTNLRSQAEKVSKTKQMYEKRVGGWRLG